MPRKVRIGSVTHTFPDDATDEEIAAALEADPAVQKEQAAAPAAVPAGAAESAPEVDMLTKVRGWLADAAKGAVKEVPNTAIQAVNATPRLATGAGAAILRALGFKDAARSIDEIAADNEARVARFRKPVAQAPDASTAEKVGRIATRTAPQLAVAAATGGSSLPVQAAVQGAASAAQTASEGGSAGEIVGSGLLGGAVPYGGPALSKTAGAVSDPLKRLATVIYARALDPSKQTTKTLATSVVPKLLDRGVTAGPVAGLRKIQGLAQEQVQALGREIGAAYDAATAAGAKIDTLKLADALDVLKVPFIEVGERAKEVASGVLDASGKPLTKTVPEKVAVVSNKAAVSAIEELQGTLRDYHAIGKTAVNVIHKFRRTIDDVVTKSNGYTRELPRGTARDISKQARQIVQGALNRAVKATKPNFEELNQTFGLWKDTLKVVAEANLKHTGQQKTLELLATSVKGSMYGGGTGLAAAGPGGAAGGAVVGGILLPAVIKAARSPFARTWTGVHMKALSDMLLGTAKALETQAGKEVATVLGLFGVKATVKPGTAPPPESSEP